MLDELVTKSYLISELTTVKRNIIITVCIMQFTVACAMLAAIKLMVT